MIKNNLPEDWEEVIFSEVIDVNPKRELKKGTKTKFVSMADIEPFQRKITNFIIKEFKGGSKFQNKDTLFARITPCLENGKTAFVDILDNEEIGFGSTEFIVLSAKEEKTDSYFIYYLSRSPEIRKVAIKSMTGTSGRQRVENEVFDSILINLPPLSEQSAIAKILSKLDDKIELNQQLNKTLEAIGQALFKRWFVDFEFPNEKGEPYKSSGGEMVDSELGEIPKGWKVGKLGECVELAYGKGLPEIKRQEGHYPVFGSNGIIGYHSDYLIGGPGIVIGRKGTLGEVYWVEENFFPIDTTFYVVDKLKSGALYFYYFMLKGKEFLKSSSDSAVPGLNRNIAYSNDIIIPSPEIISEFNIFCKVIFDKRNILLSQLNHLSQIRDSLLPRLMSGKIRVPV